MAVPTVRKVPEEIHLALLEIFANPDHSMPSPSKFE